MKRHLIWILLFVAGQNLQAQQFEKQGHRGARGLMPENTIGAMLRALDLGANTLGMNVVISKDKQVLLSHEPYFNFEISLTPAGKDITLKDQQKFNIYKMDYEEVRKFDVGSKVHKRFPGQQKYHAYKPLLEEVIDSVEAYVKKNRLPKPDYAIEIKTIRNGDLVFHPEPAEFAALVMDVVESRKMAKRVIIQAFDVRSLQYVHEHYPKQRTALMIDEKVDFEKNISDLGFNPDYYSPYAVLVGKGLVDRCHEKGIKIVPWTVNSPKDMNYMIGLGVDGIITDFPNIFQKMELPAEKEKPARRRKK
ncbi:glycerophosphodiester phosphodiesterase family protein [Pedobacter antarcticus]|uniref:Glycerophosphodiester phosphodiesterase n=2 Tax=Pedobacter antarcticus TaxID=34086 RepID=A0A081PDY8_9SPHI|nr:glycerophosphodiester phosphodiesterase family protein [Pedobacter antarcticus]KEQ28911.1 glycerophosphodiester phosphodiesterase [Pedobacter antarcticus 4BY]SDM01402.1 glycerophosphoryl diester phosphodiesterase [Pedobacter antarcticus]SFF47970.1 glycerophosphoryl diester phosphodiesterase [Pedobacter antarcticus]